MTPPTRTDTGPSFLRLVAVELRKATGTLAGRLLLLALLGIGVVGLVLEVLFAGDGVPAVFTGYAETAMFAQLLLPVVGVLMLTAEWTQRTALTTFTLVPRRGRVLAATLAAAVVLAVATVLVLAGLSAVTTLVAGGVNGVDVVWDDAGPAVAGHLVGGVLDVLLGAAFGALLQQSALALVTVLLAPGVWSTVAPQLLGESADWLDIFWASSTLSALSLGDRPAQTVTALTVWILLPLLLGTWRSLRRDVS